MQKIEEKNVDIHQVLHKNPNIINFGDVVSHYSIVQAQYKAKTGPHTRQGGDGQKLKPGLSQHLP